MAITFSYNISREDVYKPWYAWVTVISGLLFTTLFTVFNVATNGYHMSTIHTIDPNATTTENYWFQRPPFPQSGRLSNSCQEKDLVVGTAVSTDKLWRQYIIQTAQSINEGRSVARPVFGYQNQLLESCETTPVRVLFKTSSSDVAGLFLGATYQISMHATVNCIISTNPPIEITLATSWDIDGHGTMIGPVTKESAPRMLRDQPSMYWGEILRLGYYQKAWSEIVALYGNSSQISYTFLKNPNVSDMNHTNFFTAARNHYFIHNNTNHKEYRVTPPVALDRLAKAFYAEVMIDTGSPNTTVLTDPDLLEDWTADFPDDITLLSNVVVTRGGDIPTRYGQARTMNATGRLGTRPSRLYLQYVCEVPRLKPINALIGSVVVADLVYMQALWVAYTWVLTWWTRRRDPRAMCCEGCAELKAATSAPPLGTSRTSLDGPE